MARKKFEEEHENHERWLVSYADFITLLFAFFVVMYAISSVNESKYRVLSESLGSAFRNDMPAVPAAPSMPSVNPSSLPEHIRPIVIDKKRSVALRRERENMPELARDIQYALAPLAAQGVVRGSLTPRGFSVDFNASGLFAPGVASLIRVSS